MSIEQQEEEEEKNVQAEESEEEEEEEKDGFTMMKELYDRLDIDGKIRMSVIIGKHVAWGERMGLEPCDRMKEDKYPFEWMFPEEDEYEGDPCDLMNAQLDVYVQCSALEGRDMLAEANAGKSEGFVNFLRSAPPLHANPAALYREQRVKEFVQASRDKDPNPRGEKKKNNKRDRDFQSAMDAFNTLMRTADFTTPDGDECAQQMIDAMRKRPRVEAE
jgi:hypothetical protein